jgi:hypothetical protein
VYDAIAKEIAFMRILTFPCPIYQTQVSLRDVRPAIWRRILLRSDVSLARLHKILQALMGWYDYHLYQFQIRGKTHGPPREDDDDYGKRESVRIEVSTVFANGPDTILYEYDFGDGWEVDIQVEDMLPPAKQKWDAVCVDGARHGPPEDCGGPHRYQSMVAALKKGTGKEYEEYIEWIGKRFDPGYFGVREMNRALSSANETGYDRMTVQRFRDRT